MHKIHHTNNHSPEPKRFCIQVGRGVGLAAFAWAPLRAPVRNKNQVVVFVHGFAGEFTENGLFITISQALRERGYHILMYDQRGLGASSGDFSHSTLEDHITDFQKIVEWAETEWIPRGLMASSVAFSLGAAIVALAIKRGATVQRAAFLSPAVRPALWMWPRYGTSENLGRLESEGFITKPENGVRLGTEILESLRKTDLGECAFQLHVPLLVCHGTDDRRISIRAVRRIARRALAESPKGLFQFKEFVGASHSFQPAKINRDTLAKTISTWMSIKETEEASLTLV